MRSGTIAFLSGILLLQQLDRLPDALWCGLLFLIIPIIFIIPPILRAIPYFFCGFLWALLYSTIMLSSSLNESLQGKNLVIEGYISSLPKVHERSTQFEFDVTDMKFQNQSQPLPGKISLTWYNSAPRLQPGDQWRFVVRLKRPHGFMNPGGFDYEGWLFQKGIRARGYIRESPENQRITFSVSDYPLQRFRHSLADSILSVLSESPYRGIVMALAIGERQHISEEQWQVFTDTGTNHLMAISGLHVGMVSALLFFVVRYLWGNFGYLSLRFPAPKAAATAAIVGAFCYAALAGFSVPTQRAFIMLLVVMLCVIWQRQRAASEVLSLSLLAVLLFDPNSVLSAGFWLSFGAVGIILFAMNGRVGKPGIWQKWGYIHVVVGVGLIPLLLLLFQKVALLSPFANFVAVPWVSGITVPLTLLGTIAIPVIPFAGEVLLELADLSLSIIWPFLAYIASIDTMLWNQHEPPLWSIILGGVGILWLLIPRGFPARWLGLIWLTPIFLIKPASPGSGEIWFTVLDVGQGLSAVARTKNHTLVYDFGPRFNQRFDTGKAVVVPFMKNLGVDQIDTLIVSHGDNDHIGGLGSVLDQFQADRILTSAPEEIEYDNTDHCLTGQRWQWDEVSFQIIHPDKNVLFSGNNGSCVLLVENKWGHRILITGDIEKKAEAYLLKHYAVELPAHILVAPHHGSKTSSTQSFINMVNPDYVVFPVGYRNRWGFPKESVVERYQKSGVQIFDSASHGAITFRVRKLINSVETYRQSEQRYWHVK